MRCLVLGLLLAVSLVSRAPASTIAFDPGLAAFKLRSAGLEIPYRVFGWFAMPGQELALEADRPVQVSGLAGLSSEPARSLNLKLPDRPGFHPLTVSAGDDEVVLNLFVMRPATAMTGDGFGDFRIGNYPAKPFKGLPAYAPPRGFIEVYEQHLDVAVSPHFRLGQFLSKQDSGWPRYLLLRPQLLLKLERMLGRLNAAGTPASTFTVMSGYRTPWYNRAIGNRTASSRHLYGGAADIFVDESPRDGVMDDLNGDGRIDKADADHLYDLVEGWSSTPWFRHFAGGLASYGATAAHGPFVHVDARGYRVRWGR